MSKGNVGSDGEKLFSSSDEVTESKLKNLDLVCLSHLRWNFVYQRPQHLLSRAARDFKRVFFVEEPIFGEGAPRMESDTSAEEVRVCVPHLPHGCDAVAEQRRLLDELLKHEGIADFALWFYTPAAMDFAAHLAPRATIFDCMDELSMFKGASPQLLTNEAKLIERADVVFTGGQSLYEAKREQYPQHKSLHCFPSSIDFNHFAQARRETREPPDQVEIKHPRFGFFGVVDERFDTELLHEVATRKPDWQFVIIGPVVKIEESVLPRGANIHYLGGKDYKDLPRYLAGWDVATLLFARNESTRFISPTKTPEYLAAGKTVISTSIRDVVRPYGERGFVRIADTREDFIKAGEELLSLSASKRAAWLNEVDDFLRCNSWDETWRAMRRVIAAQIRVHE